MICLYVCALKPLPSDAIVLASKYGQLYQCSYRPPPAPNDGESDSRQPGNRSVVELLAPMKQASCLVLVSVCGH